MTSDEDGNFNTYLVLQLLQSLDNPTFIMTISEENKK